MTPTAVPRAEDKGLPRPALFLLALCQFLCPLVFFTDLTRNPYFTQITLMNFFLLGVLALWAWKGRGGVRAAPADLPFVCWAGVCALSLLAAFLHNSPFFRPSIMSEGVKNLLFLLVNCGGAYFIGRLMRFEDKPFDKPVAVPYLFVLWGLLWALYPDLRASASSDGILNKIFDPYGTILWLSALVVLYLSARSAALGDYLLLAFAAVAVSAGYGILQFFGVEWIWPRQLNPYGSRSVATFGNPNFLSSYLVMLLPVALVYYLRQEKFFRRLFYGFLVLLFSASMLCSLTRSSWLGAGVALCCLALMPQARALVLRSRKAALALAVPILLLTFLWPSSSVGDYHPTVSQRVSELRVMKTSPFSWDSGVYGPWHQRLLIWSASSRMGFEAPLLGRGYGLLELFYPFYQGPYLTAYKGARPLRTHANNAHNELVEAFSQTGLLGLGFFLWVLVAIFAAAWKFSCAGSPDDDRRLLAGVLTAGLLGMLADNMLNVSLHFAVPAFLFWWVAGAVSSVSTESSARLKTYYPGKTAAAVMSVVFIAGCLFWCAQWMREMRYFRGFKLTRGSDQSAAIKELEKSAFWGREVNSAYERAIAYLKSGDNAKAAASYRDAMNANAGYDELYHNLGVVLAKNPAAADEAIAALETAEWINPLNKTTHIILSELYLRNEPRYLEKARQHMARALEIFPGELGFINKQAYLQARSGNYKQAAEEFRKGVELNPYDATLYNNYRRALADAKVAPDQFVSYVNRVRAAADMLSSDGKSARTAEAVLNLAREFPQDAHVCILKARLRYVQGRYKDAYAIMSELRAREPENLNALFAMSTVCEALHDAACVRDSMQAVVALDPTNEVALSRLRSLPR